MLIFAGEGFDSVLRDIIQVFKKKSTLLIFLLYLSLCKMRTEFYLLKFNLSLNNTASKRELLNIMVLLSLTLVILQSHVCFQQCRRHHSLTKVTDNKSLKLK